MLLIPWTHVPYPPKQLWGTGPRSIFQIKNFIFYLFLQKVFFRIKGACSTKHITPKMVKVNTPEGSPQPTLGINVSLTSSFKACSSVSQRTQQDCAPADHDSKSLTNIWLFSLPSLSYYPHFSWCVPFEHLPSKQSELKQWHWTKSKLLDLLFKASPCLILAYLSM